MAEAKKKYNSIGCCGIDCVLCPRFNAEGKSKCPGCAGPGFKTKHPSCGFVSCCVIKNQLEICSDCATYPCKRFDPEREGYDSFVTHRKVFDNLDYIKHNGISCFIDQQERRTRILRDLLDNYNDGRSKSFFCVCCTLLPVEILIKVMQLADTLPVDLDIKAKNKKIRHYLLSAAESLHIELKLNRK